MTRQLWRERFNLPGAANHGREQPGYALRGGIPFQNPFSFESTIDKPFITRTAETFIPLDVWNTAALFFLSQVPNEPGARSEPYYFDLAI